VVAAADQQYLNRLYSNLLRSDEFARTGVRIDSLPADDQGKAFSDQFIGPHPSAFPIHLVVPHKKARIMDHWAIKIGGTIAVGRQ